MTTYHYVLTILAHGPTGPVGGGTGSGVITPTEGHTRGSLFDEIFRHVCDQSGVAPARATVAFFSLEPNTLGGAL